MEDRAVPLDGLDLLAHLCGDALDRVVREERWPGLGGALVHAAVDLRNCQGRNDSVRASAITPMIVVQAGLQSSTARGYQAQTDAFAKRVSPFPSCTGQ